MIACPICKLEYDSQKILFDYGERVNIDCPRCKKFTITRTAESIARTRELGPKLSAWVRNLNEQRADVPEINSNTLKTIPASLPNYSTREKQIILLQNIERKTEYPGKSVQIDPEFDIPLAWASAQEEFMYYINSLIERGLLKDLGKRGVPSHQDEMGGIIYDRPLAFSIAITADGWDYLEKLERHIEERTQAFVAMSFSEDLKPIYEGPIYNAITKAGYKPRRVDDEPHIDRIDAKIISEIKNSRFVVADVTEQKRGVYFEAGYALGLGLPVLWCVKKDDLDKVHFDTRQYNHIVWETTEGLETQLYDFICAIIGKGKEV
jgi:nucleoside 2-deoxyribosyltransferase